MLRDQDWKSENVRFLLREYRVWRRSQKSPPVRSALQASTHGDFAVRRPRTCFFCRCSASMESTIDIVATVSINRTFQAQTQKLFGLLCHTDYLKATFLNCVVRHRSTCRGAIQVTVVLYNIHTLCTLQTVKDLTNWVWCTVTTASQTRMAQWRARLPRWPWPLTLTFQNLTTSSPVAKGMTYQVWWQSNLNWRQEVVHKHTYLYNYISTDAITPHQTRTLNNVWWRCLAGVNARREEDNLLLVFAAEVRRVSDGQQVHSSLLLYSQTSSTLLHHIIN